MSTLILDERTVSIQSINALVVPYQNNIGTVLQHESVYTKDFPLLVNRYRIATSKVQPKQCSYITYHGHSYY